MADAAARYWPAPAKINLFLHVCGRREDGYHELQTLFQLLDWGDEVFVDPRDEAAVSKAGPGYGVAEDDDLAVRAARLLQSESGCRSGAEIRVRKNIPMGAGMGGGSSNAATVLLVLNELWGCGLSHDDLAALGLKLGADVPVFVRGSTALATGIGERLEAVSLGRRYYVLVFPGLAIPTPRVFADPLLRRDSETLSRSEALAGVGRNDCTPVVRRLWPAMDEAFEKLAAWGSPGMTGTGSGIFIPVPSEAEAERAAREIKNLYNCRAAAGVDRSHLHENLYTGGA